MMFTNSNTYGHYSPVELSEMNEELVYLLVINGVADDDDTLIKHYSEKVLDKHPGMGEVGDL